MALEFTQTVFGFLMIAHVSSQLLNHNYQLLVQLSNPHATSEAFHAKLYFQKPENMSCSFWDSSNS